jgi:hypothetical protein
MPGLEMDIGRYIKVAGHSLVSPRIGGRRYCTSAAQHRAGRSPLAVGSSCFRLAAALQLRRGTSQGCLKFTALSQGQGHIPSTADVALPAAWIRMRRKGSYPGVSRDGETTKGGSAPAAEP